MSTSRKSDIVVIGGGLSGTLAAAELLRRSRYPLRVTLIEKSGAVGAGVAYGTECPDHFLNVRAAAMSAIEGEPDDLLRWLRGPGEEAARRWNAVDAPEAFLPRGLYAEYVRSVLEAARVGAAPGVELHLLFAEARAIEGRGDKVLLDDGRRLPADAVIVAVGNPPPRHPTENAEDLAKGPHYTGDPWSREALADLDLDASVLIVGTNLTMVDVAVVLARRHHRGRIDIVSRHGLLPREHAASCARLEGNDPSTTVRGQMSALRRQIRVSSGTGEWRAAVDAIRPHTQRIWRNFSDVERQRFLRHARPYWEIHRHRAVPANVADLEHLRSKGQLRTHAARITGIEGRESGVCVSLLPRNGGAARTLAVDHVINATGPEGDYRRANIAVVDGLFRNQMARPGALGLGLDATPGGALLDVAGVPSEALFTLGPPLRGVLWETTAVPEIREQAARLAALLLG